MYILPPPLFYFVNKIIIKVNIEFITSLCIVLYHTPGEDGFSIKLNNG